MLPLILWDIDGTLLRVHTTVRAFNRALRTVYPLPAELGRISFGGKTDPQIVLELLALHGIGEREVMEHFPRFQAEYERLVEEAADEVARETEIMPGVPAVLGALAERGAIQSLLTGNLQVVAQLKLRAAALHDWFDWRCGAFASDNPTRDCLVPIAEGRAAALGHRYDRVVVIGDTPFDVQCARAGGARAIAVATGSFSVEALQASQPDAVLADLSDVALVLEAIYGAEHGQRLS